MLGRIYTIKCSEDPRVYVGSTYKSLDERFRRHILSSKCEAHRHLPLYQAMNEYGSDKFTIELLEEVDDCDRTVLRNIEGMHIEQHMDSLIPLFNKYIAGRDGKQWYNDNKTHIRERTKQYREDNKERIIEYGKQYYAANKEHIRECRKQYYEDNRERISKHQKQTIACECGVSATRQNLARHKRSQKHIDWESSQ